MKASKLLLLCLCFLFQLANAQNAPIVSEKEANGAFSLTDCSILYDELDAEVVKKSAALLSTDIQSVTAQMPLLNQPSKNQIIIGTWGKNRQIERLANAGRLNIKPIENGWEQFMIQRVKTETGLTLVIVGSDRRGTAYGVFTLSEAIGVSPWAWWADMPVKQRKNLFVTSDFTSQTPSVKYRGIFINDEDWGLKPWSTNNYEKELGDIGPRTYARVCELLLRLKGNMLAPAMHSCTGAFYSHPESKQVADSFAIIITTSHCEPLLFNNAAHSEWNKQRDGEWNYRTNKATILKKMDDRVKEACQYENIYTVAMRGVHDEGLRGNLPPEERVKVLSEVMADQRQILEKHINKPSEEIPQIFVPYKETMDVYEMGLEVPDDITIVWPDDNYGYIKRLSNADEQKRSGGSGVYYHFSYLGAPHDYLWINTTPPTLMYEELMKAYKTGADRYWLLNVGDIKPAELGIQTFFELAWNVNQFNYETISTYQSQYLSDIYGQQYESQFQQVLGKYYQLAWSRKPEFMGWEREWDAPKWTNLLPTDFSFQNYNDAQQRLADYEKISNAVADIEKQLPMEYRPSFFEMLGYQVKAANQMNRKFLLAQLNGEMFADNQKAQANWAADQSQQAFDSIQTLNKEYNTMLNGKWNGMMELAPGFCAKYQLMPDVKRTKGVDAVEVDLLPRKCKLENCVAIDLKSYKCANNQHYAICCVDGLGYDNTVLQMGDATQSSSDPANIKGARVEYEFECKKADSVTVHLYRVPFFPLNKERGTRVGITVDNQPIQILSNAPKEWSEEWKSQVLQNGAEHAVTFAVNPKQKKHVLTLICGDPGVMVQRIVIDWGGLKQTYVGPSAALGN